MSNSIVTNELAVLHQTQNIRSEIMNILSDADLSFKLQGDNVTLGALCREMGEVEQMYIDSFTTRTMDWTYGKSDPALAGSVEKLKVWYHTLDQHLDTVLTGLPDGDIYTKRVDRGGFTPDLHMQFHIYREALLIFYAKAACYFKALSRPLPAQMAGWIG